MKMATHLSGNTESSGDTEEDGVVVLLRESVLEEDTRWMGERWSAIHACLSHDATYSVQEDSLRDCNKKSSYLISG